jgi:hypothetical protein
VRRARRRSSLRRPQQPGDLPELDERPALLLERRRVARLAGEPGEAPRRARAPRARSAFLPGFESGWLVFRDASRHVVRRLAPVPVDWATCDDSTLESYRRRATPARELLDNLGVPLASARRPDERPSARAEEPRVATPRTAAPRRVGPRRAGE